MEMLDQIGRRMLFDARRHEILAGNIANAQTPGYTPKDLVASNFAMFMGLKKTHVAHLGPSAQAQEVVISRKGNGVSSLDGNSVDLDHERGLIARNALDLEAQMRFATHYLRQIQAAAS